MSADEERLQELEEEAARLLERKGELSKRVENRRNERDHLNESVKTIRSSALSEKELRDQSNQKVAEIKRKVEELRRQLDEKRRMLNQLEKEMGEGMGRLPPRSRLEQDLQRIEWELSTTPTLEIQEREDRLVERARETRSTLEEHGRLEALNDKRLITIADSKALEMEIRQSREEMQSIRDEGQEHHQMMLQLFEKADGEREKANEAHTGFLESVSAIREIDSELDMVMVEMRELRLRLRKVDRLEALKRETSIEEMKRELVAEARRKLEAGEKLSLEELKLIYGEGKE
ncbi:MAG: coiled-coil protein [Candidatus Bathyarchaeia archaeon]